MGIVWQSTLTAIFETHFFLPDHKRLDSESFVKTLDSLPQTRLKMCNYLLTDFACGHWTVVRKVCPVSQQNNPYPEFQPCTYAEVPTYSGHLCDKCQPQSSDHRPRIAAPDPTTSHGSDSSNPTSRNPTPASSARRQTVAAMQMSELFFSVGSDRTSESPAMLSVSAQRLLPDQPSTKSAKTASNMNHQTCLVPNQQAHSSRTSGFAATCSHPKMRETPGSRSTHTSSSREVRELSLTYRDTKDPLLPDVRQFSPLNADKMLLDCLSNMRLRKSESGAMTAPNARMMAR